MADTTAQRVKAIASNLRSMSDETIHIYIEDAKIEMQSMKYKLELEEKVMRYLAAHFGTLDAPKAVSEKVDGLGSQAFSDTTADKKGLYATPYGQEVARLLKKSHGGIIVTS